MLECDLSQVLTGIATLLVSSGYPYGKLSKIARAAFVSAAFAICEAEGRKATVAQMAASTGLSRAEVSNILQRRLRQESRISDSLSRAANVATAWKSGPEFTDSRRRPRPLPYKGSRRDFSTLVKRFSGDIPAKAMLLEMERLGMVSRGADGKLRLKRTQARIATANLHAMRAITPWVSLLKASVHDAKAQSLSSSTNQVELYFDSIPQVLAALKELKKRRHAFVHSIAELGAGPSRDNDYSLRISIAVAIARPIKAKTSSLVRV
jgi:hypothetical protein